MLRCVNELCDLEAVVKLESNLRDIFKRRQRDRNCGGQFICGRIDVCVDHISGRLHLRTHGGGQQSAGVQQEHAEGDVRQGGAENAVHAREVPHHQRYLQ